MRTERADQRCGIAFAQQDVAMPADRIGVVAKLRTYETVDVRLPVAVGPAGRDGRMQQRSEMVREVLLKIESRRRNGDQAQSRRVKISDLQGNVSVLSVGHTYPRANDDAGRGHKRALQNGDSHRRRRQDSRNNGLLSASGRKRMGRPRLQSCATETKFQSGNSTASKFRRLR
jgi:hypothetical protein